MKHFLSLILTFLIILPSCGMVFASASDGIMNHVPMIAMDMLAMDSESENVGLSEHVETDSSWKNCCTEFPLSNIERENV